MNKDYQDLKGILSHSYIINARKEATAPTDNIIIYYNNGLNIKGNKTKNQVEIVCDDVKTSAPLYLDDSKDEIKSSHLDDPTNSFLSLLGCFILLCLIILLFKYTVPDSSGNDPISKNIADKFAYLPLAIISIIYLFYVGIVLSIYSALVFLFYGICCICVLFKESGSNEVGLEYKPKLGKIFFEEHFNNLYIAFMGGPYSLDYTGSNANIKRSLMIIIYILFFICVIASFLLFSLWLLGIIHIKVKLPIAGFNNKGLLKFKKPGSIKFSMKQFTNAGYKSGDKDYICQNIIRFADSGELFQLDNCNNQVNINEYITNEECAATISETYKDKRKKTNKYPTTYSAIKKAIGLSMNKKDSDNNNLCGIKITNPHNINYTKDGNQYNMCGLVKALQGKENTCSQQVSYD